MKRVPSATQTIEITGSAQCHPIARWSAERESLFYNRRNAIWLCVGALWKQSVGLIRQSRTPQHTIGIRMKKIIVATVLAAIGSTAALAADLGARAPYSKAPAMVAAVGSWSGFYLGGNVGYG